MLSQATAALTAGQVSPTADTGDSLKNDGALPSAITGRLQRITADLEHAEEPQHD
jgi:hypothetical protein